MRITAAQAAGRIRAALGRHPQDALEATVALEAWGGLGSRTALGLSSAAIDRSTPRAGGLLRSRPPGETNNVSTLEMFGLVATLLATVAWVAPLANALGLSTTARAWQIALPISLALQWFLRRRYLNGPNGLSTLRSDKNAVTAIAVVCVVVPIDLLLAPALVLPAALVLTWVGGLLVVVRGWGVPYAASLVMATFALELGVPVVLDVVFVVILTGLTLGAALLTTTPVTDQPTPWRRSLPAGFIGGTMALLIVTDPSVEWTSADPFPVVALVPALLASIWAGRYLNRIWTVLLDTLASTSLLDRSKRPSWGVFARILLGSFGRLVLGTLLLSAVAFALLRERAGSGTELAGLLLALGAFGLVSYLASLLESMSRVRAAIIVVVIAVVVAQWAAIAPIAGPVLPIAALAGLIAAIPSIVALVRQPDRTIATLF